MKNPTLRAACPKILFYDIETKPNLAYVWGKYEQNVIDYKEEWEMLSFAYKWAGESTVRCLTRQGQKSDKALVKKLHALFNEADIVVAHNGDEFDQKKSRARMVFYGLTPTKPVPSIDTMKVAKRYFNFNGNGLNDLARHLKIGKKTKNPGFDLWLGCMADKPESWDLMIRYNKKDVVLLEKIYQKFLPWIQTHPRAQEKAAPDGTCPNCSSKRVQKRGFKYSTGYLKQTWFCRGCDKWFHTKLDKEASK